MARIRSIKPEFFSSPSAAACSFPARLLYIAMWTIADDWGVGEANPKMLAAEAFPFDEISSKEVPCLCKEIADNFEVVFYEVKGRSYFQILNWDEHQVTQRRAKRRYPTSDSPFAQVTMGKQELPCVDKELPCELKEDASTEQGNRGTGEQGNINICTSPDGDAQSAPKPKTYSEGFETFWRAYPVKKGKRRAYDAWKKALKRATPETIIDGATAYAAWCAQHPTVSIKYPEGWLSGSRWEDDLTTGNTGRSDAITLLDLAGRNLGAQHA